jgi:hypothetical protein
MASTLVSGPAGQRLLVTKGAPEAVLAASSDVPAAGRRPATPSLPGASRLPTAKTTPSATAAPGPPGENPADTIPACPGFTLTPADHPSPPGGYGTWRFTNGHQDLIIQIGPIPTGDCDHRHETKGHDPGVMLRHLAEIRHAMCTGPGCRRPAASCDYEHNTPYQAGGRTCLCNGNPKCRHDHRLKQHPRWHAQQLPDGSVLWTTPSGRQYSTEPTRYPI